MAQVRAGGSTTDFQSLDGVLSFFLVENGDTLVAGYNGADANSLEEVRQVIEQRGTAVIFNHHANASNFSIAIANSDWTATNLQAGIRALGATVGADTANCEASAVTETGFVLQT